MNFHKLWLIVAIIFVGYNTANAEIIDAATAQKVAISFLKQQSYAQQKFCNIESLQLANYNRVNETPDFYIFTMDKGFIIISSESATTPVLAYSLDDNIDLDNPAPGAQMFLNRYKDEIHYIRENLTLAEHPLWNQYLHPNVIIAKKSDDKFVTPLLTSRWNQTKFYNALCPYDKAAGEANDFRAPVGCVALAMASIMEYYRYPTTGEGSNSYYPSASIPPQDSAHYGRIGAKFYNQIYNYNAMKDVPNAYNSEMAKLIYHCGISVKMNYTPDASGSNGGQAKDALVQNWKFDHSLSIKKRTEYSNDTTWLDDIKAELDLKRPLYFSGTSESEGGHAFVCDGYDKDGKVHINWGWGGLHNGYFVVTNLAPGSMKPFNKNSEFFKNLFPATTDYLYNEGHKRLTASSGSFVHGTFPNAYPAGKTYSWMIAAENAYDYTFSFLRLNTDSADKIIIYNGPREVSGIHSTYCGHPETLPSGITISKDSVLVKFVTTKTGEGFELAYTTRTPTAYCAKKTTLRELSGTIKDKSNQKRYNYESVCSWILETPDQAKKALQLEIDTFDVGMGDYINIYSGDSMKLIYHYDTLTPKRTVVLDGYDKIILTFISDNYDNGNGFSINYNWQVGTGVAEMNNNETLKVFPNPATSEFSIDCKLDNPSDMQLDVLDITGKVLYSEKIESTSHYTNTYNVADLSRGIYFLRIQTDNGTQNQKLVIR